jgi:hypothetical protein
MVQITMTARPSGRIGLAVQDKGSFAT